MVALDIVFSVCRFLFSLQERLDECRIDLR